MSVDLNDLRPLDILPEGRYRASIVSAEEKISKAGNPMIEVVFRIEEEEHSRLLRDWILRRGRWGKAKLLAYQEALDGQINDGDRVHLQIVHDTYEGDLTNKVVGIAAGWEADPVLFASPNPGE